MCAYEDETLTVAEVPAPDGQRILRLSGPLVLSSFFEFQTLIREDQTDALILDFTAVPYIDSAGIGALVGAYVNRQKTGRRSCWWECSRGCGQPCRSPKSSSFRFSDSLAAAGAS